MLSFTAAGWSTLPFTTIRLENQWPFTCCEKKSSMIGFTISSSFDQGIAEFAILVLFKTPSELFFEDDLTSLFDFYRLWSRPEIQRSYYVVSEMLNASTLSLTRSTCARTCVSVFRRECLSWDPEYSYTLPYGLLGPHSFFESGFLTRQEKRKEFIW